MRTLRDKIQAMLFERTSISRKPEVLARKELLALRNGDRMSLNWLDQHERRPGEESPLGLILCAGKPSEHVELLKLERSGIRVAEYLTELPPREVLENKLHAAIEAARRRLDHTCPTER